MKQEVQNSERLALPRDGVSAGSWKGKPVEGHKALPYSWELITLGILRLELPSQVFGVVEEFILENTEFWMPVRYAVEMQRWKSGVLVYT